MQLGVDYVSLAIFLAAYAFSNVHAVPIKVRYGVMAAACTGIGLLRIRQGVAGTNLIFAGIGLAFGLYYLVQMFRVKNR